MAVSTSNIVLGMPDQATTGAVNWAATTATMPADAVTALGQGWTASGYVTEDGLTVTPSLNTSTLKDWSRSTVKTFIDSFEGKVKFSEMEALSYEAACHAFGAANVTKTTATASHGTQLTIAMKAELPEAKAWCFNMKDGNARMRVLLPNAQVANFPEMTFAAGSAVTFPIELNCYPDEDGVSIYIFTDDGVTTA